MKKSLFVIGLLSVVAGANAVTIATWTFETSIPATAGPHAAELGLGAASGFHASTSAVYSNPSGNGSVESFSSNFWSVGDYYQFQVSTVGMAGVSFTWDHTSSNTGPRDFVIQYSNDGTSFTNVPGTYAILANVAPNAWNTTTNYPLYTNTLSLAAATLLDNQANIWIRVTNSSTVSANGGVVATGGTSRVDNVTIAANPVPEPATLAILGLGGAALLRRRNKK